MILVDDRTPEQKRTHNMIILGTDSLLSGWGGAGDGPSYAGWAFQEGDQAKVEAWVRSRSDMKRVRLVFGKYRPPTGEGHCHIYVVTPGHNSLN